MDILGLLESFQPLTFANAIQLFTDKSSNFFVLTKFFIIFVYMMFLSNLD